jgi:CRISPR-associated protein Cas1
MFERCDNSAVLASSDEWPDRCRYWAAKADATPTRKRRERRIEPLILSGHGMSVRVDKGCLIVKGGNTHYPTTAKEHRFFRGGLDLPPRIVALDGSGTLTLDAIDWVAEQGIALVRINYDGSHAVGFSPNGYAANPDKVRWQLETRDNPKAQLQFAKDVIRGKFEAALETLAEYVPNSKSQLAAIEISRNAIAELPKAKSLSDLLGIEGKAANAYWAAWRSIAMKWKSESRHPIPAEWKAFNARSSVLSGKKWKNWRAANPINAMLNYAYAALLTEMRIKAITDGYDPMIGILHDQRHKEKERTPSFALDLMEPLRPVVDRAVLKLIAEETFSGADFQLQSDGVCRLNPQLAKVMALRASQSTRVGVTIANHRLDRD